MDANARFIPGETIFAETRRATAPQQAPIIPPSQPAIDVIPFVREATASFFADSATPSPLPPGDDCDGDGIANSAEAAGDLDADGLPNVCDDDADNDDEPDSLDPDPLDPNVPTPRSCETDPAAVACCAALAECTGTQSFAIYAQGELRINDRAQVVSGDAPGAVVNAGNQQTHLGVDSEMGDVWSEAHVFAAERAFIDGDLSTGGELTEQNNVIVTGELSENTALEFPDLEAFSVTFPTEDQGNRNLEPGQMLSLSPGAYHDISVKSGATLQLSTGSYFLTGSFRLEPQGTVELDTSLGPVFLYVQEGFLYKGGFVDSQGEHHNVFVGYFGTQDVFAESAFSGRWLRLMPSCG